MTGRPAIYTDEQRIQAIKLNQLRAYLKKNNKTQEEYDLWRSNIDLKKKITKLKNDFNDVLLNKDETKIALLIDILSS